MTFLWVRASFSAVGAAAAFMVLFQIRRLLPDTSRRTELIFILMVAMVLLLWSLTTTLILLVRCALTESSSRECSESAAEIPLSTDIKSAAGQLDSPRGSNEQQQKGLK